MKMISGAIAIKIILAVLFYFAIGRQLYSYYQFIKLAAFAGSLALIWIYRDTYLIESIIAGAGVLLFNPLFKMTFKRDVWQEIDYYLAVGCAVWVVTDLIKIFVFTRDNRKKAREKVVAVAKR